LAWYDWFSNFYDASLERLYHDARLAAAAALQAEPHHALLDLPCGTGQSFDALAPKVAALVGVDLSEGMLRRARTRVAAHGWPHVRLLRCDVHALALADLHLPTPRLDRLHVFLGLSTFPRWEAAFEHLWSLLVPGGRCVVVDVHSARPGLQGRMVNLVAGADIRRRTWEPLERLAVDFTREDLSHRRQHGGQIFLAACDKPA
jgi:ubiquinone/menaquinone biosynthesis C-methylase UbiE